MRARNSALFLHLLFHCHFFNGESNWVSHYVSLSLLKCCRFFSASFRISRFLETEKIQTDTCQRMKVNDSGLLHNFLFLLLCIHKGTVLLFRASLSIFHSDYCVFYDNGDSRSRRYTVAKDSVHQLRIIVEMVIEERERNRV